MQEPIELTTQQIIFNTYPVHAFISIANSLFNSRWSFKSVHIIGNFWCFELWDLTLTDAKSILKFDILISRWTELFVFSFLKSCKCVLLSNLLHYCEMIFLSFFLFTYISCKSQFWKLNINSKRIMNETLKHSFQVPFSFSASSVSKKKKKKKFPRLS